MSQNQLSFPILISQSQISMATVLPVIYPIQMAADFLTSYKDRNPVKSKMVPIKNGTSPTKFDR